MVISAEGARLLLGLAVIGGKSISFPRAGRAALLPFAGVRGGADELVEHGFATLTRVPPGRRRMITLTLAGRREAERLELERVGALAGR